VEKELEVMLGNLQNFLKRQKTGCTIIPHSVGEQQRKQKTLLTVAAHSWWRGFGWRRVQVEECMEV